MKVTKKQRRSGHFHYSVLSPDYTDLWRVKCGMCFLINLTNLSSDSHARKSFLKGSINLLMKMIISF